MTFAILHRAGLILPLLIAASLIAVVAVDGAIEVQAQEPTTIRGRVIAGTGDAALPPDIPVLLLVASPEGELAATRQVAADEEGGFEFDQVPRWEGGVYTLSVDYAGVFYSTSLSLQDLSDEVRLTVYEPTQDASVVKVARQLLVIADVDAKNREVSALEFVLLDNISDRTLLPDLANPERLNFLRFALPPQAEGLDVRSDLPDGDIISIGTGFALTSAVTPGEHSLDFTFRFPYRGDRVAYRQSLPQGAEVYQVLVPQRLPGVTVSPLQTVSEVSIDSSLYRVWEGRDFGRGQGITLELSNLPEPSLGARLEKSVTDGTFWKIAIPSALGAALAFLLLFGVLKAPKRQPGTSGSVSGGVTKEPANRDAIVREIAELDERFQQGGVEEDIYHRQRVGLVSRILGPSATVEPPDGPGG